MGLEIPREGAGLADLREAAVAHLKAAKDLADGEGNIPADKQDEFDAIWAGFTTIDGRLKVAEANAGKARQASERFTELTAIATGGPGMRFNATELNPRAKLSMGQQFVQSEEYRRLKASGVLTSPDAVFRSLPVTVGNRIPYGAAATDVIQTESGGPGAALVEDYRPGIVQMLPQRPRVVRDLFPNVDMPSGDTIKYAAQTGFDNAAAAVAQATTVNTNTLAGGLKPQSSIAFAERTAEATWIATWMVVTRQALADETQMMSIIDNQGRLMISLAEDDALVNGDGTAPNISGILDQPAIQTLDLTGVDNLDGIRTARRLTATGTARLPATFIILHPTDSEEFDLLKDGDGQYRGGNPIGNFNFDQSIWRLQRVESEALAAGTAIVGSRAAATIYDREPLRVLTADQHSDFFVRNLVVVLFEERLAFPVYFPTAFVEVTLAEWVS